MTVLEVGVVGKLPAWADFVRLGARGDSFESLLSWMIDGTERAAALPRTSGERSLSSPGHAVHAFAYSEPGAAWLLAGALSPSSDQAGRGFPLAAAAELVIAPAERGEPGILPILLEGVWAATGELVQQLRELDRQSIAAQPAWQVELAASAGEALATYRRWTEELALQEFLALVFGGDIVAAARGIATTEEAVRPYRNVEAPATPLSLRLPLGEAGGAAVCFWLDLVKRLAGWRQTLPSFFWSHDGGAGALMLHLGSVPLAAFAELWAPTGRCDEVCDLVLPAPVPWQSERVALWQGVLMRPESRLCDLLEAARGGLP
jgi:type VI secretion system ImpM family protein